MKKNISRRVKLVSILICVCIFILQTFLGCDESYTQPQNSRLRIQSDFTNYIAENFDEYKSRIKEETGLEGKIVSEETDGKEQKYIEFDIDNITQIRFEANDVGVIITKQLAQSNETNYKEELEILLAGMDEDCNVHISISSKFGYISCMYKANDLENPVPSTKEKEEGINSQIKSVVSTKELEKLISKAHSIYDVFDEICEEYNESLEK